MPWRRHPTIGLVLAGLLTLPLLAATDAGAGAYNIQLYTDSTPDYTTRQSFLETVLPVWDDPQDQAIAIWRWGVRHRRQTSTTREEGRGIYDPILLFNSYPNTYCAFIAGAQQSLYEAIGGDWRARYVELADHTVSEVSWDAGASWHLFDASMDVYCLRHDGGVASVPEIASAHSCALSQALGAAGDEPGHYYLYHAAQECSSNPVDPSHAGDLAYPWGYRVLPDRPIPYVRTLRNGADSYISGFTIQEDFTHIRYGHRYRLNLRRWESYTRYWTHLGETADYYRPTTYGMDPDAMEPTGAMRGNGLWVFRPDLSSTDYQGPNLHPAAAGVAGEVVFQVYGANAITSAALHLEGLRTAGADDLRLSISRDAGINWQEVWSATATGPVVADVPLSSTLLGGAPEYLVRLRCRAASDRRDCGLDVLEIRTVTQVNALALPRLVRGANRVRLRLGEQVESHVLWPPLHDDGAPRYRDSADSWENVFAGSLADEFWRAVLRPLQGGIPAQVTWRFTAPAEIVGLRYGGSFYADLSGSDDRVRLLHSWDGGAFEEDGVFTSVSAPTRDGRLYATVSGAPPGARAAWLRYEFGCSQNAYYNSTGLQDALMEVSWEPRDPMRQPVEVTYCWTEHRVEGDVVREHTQLVTGVDQRWTIDVGGFRDPTMNWVRLNLRRYGPDGENTVYGYADGQDVGPGAGYDKRRYGFAWLDDVARDRSYVVSRPAAASNPDTDGRELTNGCVIPPTVEFDSDRVQVQTALWDPGADVVVALDLAQLQPVAALRVTTHQPDQTYCHAARIEVACSADGVTYTPLGTILHDDIWSPPGDELPWERGISPDFAGLPAGGNLAHAFWLPLATPVTARYVECRFVPLPDRGLSISEIQILSQFTQEDWPDREVYMPVATAVTEPPGPGAGNGRPLAAGSLLLTGAPNPFNAITDLSFELTRPCRVDLRIYDISGRLVRVLLSNAPCTAGRHTITWAGEDARGRPLPSGVYFAHLQGDGRSAVGRLTLVK